MVCDRGGRGNAVAAGVGCLSCFSFFPLSLSLTPTYTPPGISDQKSGGVGACRWMRVVGRWWVQPMQAVSVARSFQ